MRGACTMIRTVLLLVMCSCVHSSGVAHNIAAVAAPAPVVAASSSQYFERTFNRLVAAPSVPEPVFHVASVAPVAPAPPVFVQPVTRTVPAVQEAPTQNVPIEPNVAIAIATAHAAAPVATILLPPYPFRVPATFGFSPPIVVPDEPKKESTTQASKTFVQTTVREPEATTPLPAPSNTDNAFARPLPSNQNTNFREYYAPPLPQPQPSAKPQKLKTSVEVVPVPLRYIAPPPIALHHHHHHHHGHPVKYVHEFVPAKLIVRPAPVRVHSVRVPARLVVHSAPLRLRKIPRSQKNLLRSRAGNARDTEPTTFSPLNRPITKPPRV